MIWAFLHCKYLILGYQIIVVTDHKPLLAIFRKELPDALMSRCIVLVVVQEYSPCIRHILGKSNLLADSLSRYCDVQEVFQIPLEDGVLVEDIALVTVRDERDKMWVRQEETLASEQEKDPTFDPILTLLKIQKITNPQQIPKNMSSYFLQGDILYKFACSRQLENPVRYSVCSVSSVFFEASCMAIHKFTNHAAVERALVEHERLIYHPELSQCMKKEEKLCENCLQMKGKVKPSPLLRVPVAHIPFEVIVLNFISTLLFLYLRNIGIVKEKLFNSYVFVIVDQLTRYLMAVPTKDRTAGAVVKTLQEKVFTTFNVPRTILTDNAREFVGEVMVQMAEHYKIKLVNSTPYHPHGNGMAEWSVQKNKKKKKKMEAIKLFCGSKAIWFGTLGHWFGTRHT